MQLSRVPAGGDGGGGGGRTGRGRGEGGGVRVAPTTAGVGRGGAWRKREGMNDTHTHPCTHISAEDTAATVTTHTHSVQRRGRVHPFPKMSPSLLQAKLSHMTLLRTGRFSSDMTSTV